jgi:alkylation response protein AidB-like acyl-CoA dehydrogenase/predicted heme/steroid binding protein
MTTVYTLEEVEQHNKRDDLWCVIDGDVYDLTAFVQYHPGSAPPLLNIAGKDATKAFFGLHRSAILKEPRYRRYKIGIIHGTEKKRELLKEKKKNVNIVLPYGESEGYWRRKSPYYNQSHTDFRQAIREFIDREIRPDAIEDDEEGNYPEQELNEKMGQAGLIACLVAMIPEGQKYIRDLNIKLPGNVPCEKFDYFHSMIFSEELRRLGTYGLGDGLVGGNSIGLPVIVKFGSKELCNRIVPDVLLGKKRCALAISEPYAGSDVAQIQTKGVQSKDGTHFIVSGVKKWITGGMFADYFSTLISTSNGMTMVVIDRQMSGGEAHFNTKQIYTSYSKAAGTSYVTMDECYVPIENVVGTQGKGFYYTMSNFNTERWGMVCSGNRLSRLMLEECFRWSMARKIFSKRLIDQPVIRAKLAAMAAEIESVHSMLEDLTYQMCNMSPNDMNSVLAGPIALLKYKQTRVANMVADNACQILGGRALTRSGMGVLIEKFQRSQKMQAILGGSEEIMADFAMRQAIKSVGKGEIAEEFSRM